MSEVVPKVGDFSHHVRTLGWGIQGHAGIGGEEIDPDDALTLVMPHIDGVHCAGLSSDEGVEVAPEAFRVDPQFVLLRFSDRSLFDLAVAQAEHHVDKISNPDPIRITKAAVLCDLSCPF